MSLLAVPAGAPWREVPGGTSPGWYTDAAREYEAATRAAGLVDRSHAGRLRISGAQRLTYLQRITAQDFQGLEPPGGVLAAILERRGKVIDVVSAHAFPEHLLVLTSAGLKEETSDWIRKFIFRDDVQVEDQAEASGQLLLVGPQAADVARGWAGEGAADLAPRQWMTHPKHDGCVLIRDGAAGWQAFHVVVPADRMETIGEELLAAGGEHGLEAVGEDAYQAVRVLAGVPEAGAELDQRTNPMELRLTDSFSLSKGCYTGQEVMAKMQTHDSVKRLLVGLELATDQPPARDTALFSNTQAVGRITTALRRPGAATCIGLALVGRDAAAPEGLLRLEDGTEGRVKALPLPA
jgi:folate-binding protein YgfZ